jgi:hypothetical protein
MLSIPLGVRSYLSHRDQRCNGVQIQEIFGTEHFATFIYAYCRMVQPDRVVELGTGIGATTLAISCALQANGCGHLDTVDNGNCWQSVRKCAQSALGYCDDSESYKDFVGRLVDGFDLSKYVTHHFADVLDSSLSISSDIDILFADALDADVTGCRNILRHYLPRMAKYSSFFIDRAATVNHSYLFLRDTVACLNENKVPQFLVDRMSNVEEARFRKKVGSIRFQLVPLTEKATRKVNKNQNSRAWIRIEPVDFVHHNGVDNWLHW